MELRSIIEKYLRENKFDGLYSSHFECGCELDDLFPCDEPRPDCSAGYKVKCNGCEYGNCEWHIAPSRESTVAPEQAIREPCEICGWINGTPINM